MEAGLLEGESAFEVSLAVCDFELIAGFVTSLEVDPCFLSH
jgi:hypothetical protein